MAIREMISDGCEEVVLEAEVCNTGALKLYQVRMGRGAILGIFDQANSYRNHLLS